MKSGEEPAEGTEENAQNAVPLDIETYLDTPPLMRDYIVQYQLN